MAERRKSERRSISYYLRIIDADSNLMLGHLGDITLQGLKMDSQKPLPVKKNIGCASIRPQMWPIKIS